MKIAGRLRIWSDSIVGVLAGATLFLLMALTAVDVVGRYLLSRPLPGSLELTEIMMSVMIFAALPLVTARGGHIAVDLADHLFPERLKRWIDRLVSLVCAAGLAVLAWRLAVKAMQLGRYGDVTAALTIPLYPLAWFMAVGVGLTAIVLLLRLLPSPALRASAPHAPAIEGRR
jgi:TRAP-type C4-dicarboxylate transport system permease small subunit